MENISKEIINKALGKVVKEYRLKNKLTQEEIAEKLDIAVETVKKQKQIARKILKEKFGKLFLFLPAVLFS